MLVFAHIGITVGITYVTQKVTLYFNKDSFAKETAPNNTNIDKPGRIPDIIKNIDYRFIILGSILPDLIDKPIGNIFFVSVFSNGRIFFHTLLIFMLTMAIALALFKTRGRAWLIYISFGMLIHLLLDGMWLYPEILLWPLYGLEFPRLADMAVPSWTQGMLFRLLNWPSVYIPEIVGIGIIAIFMLKLFVDKKVIAFLKYGNL